MHLINLFCLYTQPPNLAMGLAVVDQWQSNPMAVELVWGVKQATWLLSQEEHQQTWKRPLGNKPKNIAKQHFDRIRWYTDAGLNASPTVPRSDPATRYPLSNPAIKGPTQHEHIYPQNNSRHLPLSSLYHFFILTYITPLLSVHWPEWNASFGNRASKASDSKASVIMVD